MYQLLTGLDITPEKPLEKSLGSHGRLGSNGGIVHVTLVRDNGDDADVFVTGSLEGIRHWLYCGYGNYNEVEIEMGSAARHGRLERLH